MSPTNLATTTALSATWFMSSTWLHNLLANCILLYFVFNPIPHLRNRPSLSCSVSFLCICFVSISLSRRKALSLFTYSPNKRQSPLFFRP
ncbi:hypothetical protein HanPI659440_Chr07g0262501 [Helianthus annuus]|nr:hypothetical protein HanPI659440_Chr07g0262501 [Helianthus annuus]